MRQPRRIVREFGLDSGYTNHIYNSGIRKDNKRGTNWTYRNPEEMLVDFLKWLRENEYE